MIRPASPLSPSAPSSLVPSPIPPGETFPSAYGRRFWLAYAANSLAMVAISLLYRYADFVAILGGTELELGWIVGVGMVGSLAMRLALGAWIDQHGPRRIWLGSLGLFCAACLAHLAVGTCHGPAVYAVRIAYCCAVAGIFGSSMTFISGRVPPARTAELVGMLGTSGFLGAIVGTQLGDLMLGASQLETWQVQGMFVVAAALGGASSVFVWLATRGHPKPPPQNRPSLGTLVRRYHPGWALAAGVAMGIGLGLPAVFLRAYAAQLGIAKIGLFFAVYAPAAILTRVATRRLPERLGPKPMILMGLLGVALSLLALLPVRVEWHLVLPGIGFGIAHAVLFPAVVAAGTERFPAAHRGLGTTLILGTWDAGQLLGAPMVGGILHYSLLLGLPPYPTMFVVVAGLMAAVAGFYAMARRGVSVGGVAEAAGAVVPAPVAEFARIQPGAVKIESR
jgi:MFS family permease